MRPTFAAHDHHGGFNVADPMGKSPGKHAESGAKDESLHFKRRVKFSIFFHGVSLSSMDADGSRIFEP